MKSLYDYLIQEKLHLNKDFHIDEKVKIEIPKSDGGEIEDIDDAWKTLEIPKKKFVVYCDTYRGNLMHFAGLGDMIGEFIYFQGDYEDWDPEKKIYYASDDLDEIIKWYFNKLNLPMKAFNCKNYEEAFELIDDVREGTADSSEFFARVAIGDWTEDDVDYIYKIEDKDFDDMKSWFKKSFN